MAVSISIDILYANIEPEMVNFIYSYAWGVRMMDTAAVGHL